MKLLTKQHQESYKHAKVCYICKEKIENKFMKDKSYCKVRGHAIIQRNVDVLHIAYVII